MTPAFRRSMVITARGAHAPIRHLPPTPFFVFYWNRACVNIISYLMEAFAMHRTITRSEVTEQLLALGVKPGDVLLAHTAFSKVSLVEGGPRGLIEALLAALGVD